MPKATSYHWVLTLQTQYGDVVTADGVLAVESDTRQSIYRGLVNQVKDTQAITHLKTITLFFSLEENEIGGGH
jgi:hypothetical protein